MNKTQLKRILQDPVKEFSRRVSNADHNAMQTLEQLAEQYRLLKSQYHQAQQESGVIARKIGAAKQNGEPFEELKITMQNQNARTQAVANELKTVEQQIMHVFADLEPQRSGNAELPVLSEPRCYRGLAGALNDIAIQRLECLESQQPAWNAYVSQNPDCSNYHRIEWKALIQETFGHEPVYFFAQDKLGTVLGILPLFRLKSRLFGDFLVSMPYFNYGGAIADDPRIEDQLIQAANDYATQVELDHVEYRDNVARDGLAQRAEKVNMILPLPEQDTTLWQGFSPKLRAQIKRPQRENPELRIGGREYLDDFYAVFARNMRDLGTPVYAKQFFANILKFFPDQSHTLILRLNNKPVAAAFLLGHGNKLEIPWASTISDVNHLSMNMLLYWEVLRFAIENHYKFFDFGRSSIDSGTYRFKKQWGAVAQNCYWHYWLRNSDKLPQLNPNNPKYKLFITVWKKLPVALTQWLGPMIVKNIP